MAHRQIGSVVIDGRFVQDHFPGIGRYTFNLIRALAQVAPDRTFTIWHNPSLRNTRYDLAALAQYPNIHLERLDVHTFSVREQWQMPARLNQAQARLYHSPYYIMPYRPGIPTIVTIYDLLPIRYPRYFTTLQNVVFALTIRLAVRAATRVVAISQATAADLRTLLHVPDEKISVIPLAADPVFNPQPRSEIERVCEQYGLRSPYFLYVGINKPHKDLPTLVDAWRQTRGAASALVIAGAWDSRYGSELRQSKEEGITLIHDVPERDLPALYSGAVAFVMPSLYEGFGLPVLEAMACGAPVITSDTSSLPEVVGDAALYFEPHNAQQLAELLLRVRDNSALQDELRAKSLQRAAKFSWERTARETLRVYLDTETREM